MINLSKMISQEEFEHEIFELSGDEYTVLGKYTGCANKVDLRHNVCGKTYSVRFPNFRRGQRCPHCSGNFKKSQSIFVDQLNDVHNGKIICLGNYKNTHTKIKFKCVVCGHEWMAEPKTLISKQRTGCPKCYGNVKRTHEQFCNEIYSTNKDIMILSYYNGAQNKILCKCKVCGNEWHPFAANLLRGSGCPICSSSKGERQIRNYLVENNIRFETQKECYGLVGINGGNLRYDFFIPDVGENGIFIEYQGEQHEKPIDFDGAGKDIAIEKYNMLCEHDTRKYEYAKCHGIELIEIWYYDYDRIDTILDYCLKIKNQMSTLQ